MEDIYRPVALGDDLKWGKKGERARLLGDRLERYRQRVRQQVVEELQHWPCASFQLELGLFTRLQPWLGEKADNGVSASMDITSVGPLASASLDRSYQQSRRWGKRLKKLNLEERHSMRKSLKTLRYQGEIFGSLYRPKPAGRFEKRLKSLQDIFGYLNDVAMAGRLGTIAQGAGVMSKADRRIVKRVVIHHEKRARKEWRKAQRRWLKLDKTNLFWR